MRSLVDNDRFNDLTGLGSGKRIVDVLVPVCAGELLDGEPSLAPQVDQVGDKYLRDGAALNDGGERPALDQRLANLKRDDRSWSRSAKQSRTRAEDEAD